MARYWGTLQFTWRTASRTSKDMKLWDTPFSLPPSVITEWREFHDIIRHNEWRQPPKLPEDILQCRSLLACDSCETSAGNVCSTLQNSGHHYTPPSVLVALAGKDTQSVHAL